MGSSRFILVLLGIIFLIIVVFSSNKIMDAIRKKTGLQNQSGKISEAQITITPIPTAVVLKTQDSFKGSEIPSTGPAESLYLLLAGSYIAGKMIKKFRD